MLWLQTPAMAFRLCSSENQARTQPKWSSKDKKTCGLSKYMLPCCIHSETLALCSEYIVSGMTKKSQWMLTAPTMVRHMRQMMSQVDASACT